MNNTILRTIARVSLYTITLFSFYLLFRGHNEPGGGFIGGLMTSAAIVLQAVAFDAAYAARLIPIDPPKILAVGLLFAAGTGLASIFGSAPFLTHSFGNIEIPLLGTVELATALFFDLGVYFVVVGVTQWMIVTVANDREDTLFTATESKEETR